MDESDGRRKAADGLMENWFGGQVFYMLGNCTCAPCDQFVISAFFPQWFATQWASGRGQGKNIHLIDLWLILDIRQPADSSPPVFANAISSKATASSQVIFSCLLL